MPTLEHVALKARDLALTDAFYTALGARTSRHAAGTRLFAEFNTRTHLIFDATDLLPDVSAITYLGLELESDAEVDALIEHLSQQFQIARDVRDQYRHTTGPYGFFVNDPDGYVLKVFKYHD